MDISQFIVVHDDELDIPAGDVRLKLGGGDCSHNGLPPCRSPSAPRTTRGCGRDRAAPGRQDPADFVLLDFSPTERKALPFLVDEAAVAVKPLVAAGLLESQQRFHAQ